MPATKFIAYYRVSTERQGSSGLGLEAQEAAVAAYVGIVPILSEFREVESGKSHTNRPQLLAALRECKKQKATLLIAKLDRLGRNVAFIAALIESGADFICCDNPHANRLMLHMLAAFAEHEREIISARTKAALAAAKVRGARLGGDRGKLALARAEAAVVRQAKAQSRVAALRPIVEAQRAAARSEGRTASLREVAARLNDRGLCAPRGGLWHSNTVRRVMQL